MKIKIVNLKSIVVIVTPSLRRFQEHREEAAEHAQRDGADQRCQCAVDIKAKAQMPDDKEKQDVQHKTEQPEGQTVDGPGEKHDNRAHNAICQRQRDDGDENCFRVLLPFDPELSGFQ